MSISLSAVWNCRTVPPLCRRYNCLVNWTKYFAIFLVGWLAFCTFGYYIYALIMGGKYCVLFEMDEDGVLHKQMPKAVKKAQIISALTVLAGLASKNVTTTGVGILAASKTSTYSAFSSVTSIEVFRRRNLIKVNSPLNYNQVYAQDEDFDFVLNYIMQRIPKKAKISGISTYQKV